MQANIPSSYDFIPGNVPDSSEYLKSKKCSEIYLGENKRKKSKNKKYYPNTSHNVLCYNIGRAYTLNYPSSSNNVYISNDYPFFFKKVNIEKKIYK